MAKTGIESISIRDVTYDPTKLSAETRRFMDPLDRRTELKIIFADHPFATFFRAWLIMGIDDEYQSKCLFPIEELTQYTAVTHGGHSTVHGSNLSIYTTIQNMAIDQDLPIGAQFSLTVPMVEGTTAVALFADNLVPVTPLPPPFDWYKPRPIGAAAAPPSKTKTGRIPFNRRNFIMCINPNESLSMKFRVGYDRAFSVRGRSHWYLEPPRGIIVCTQLGRHPVDYLKVIIGQLRTRLIATENNRFDYMLLKSGLNGKREEIVAYFEKMHNAIEGIVIDMPARS